MRSHPISGSARTPNDSAPHRTIVGERRQLTPTALTPAVLEEHGGAWRPHPGYQRDLLLTTKHAIPPQRTHTMARPHLHDRLNQGLDRKLTLVAAPAGYGKTSLLSAWAQHQTSTLAWLTLDPADNDLKHFWTYVIAALDALRPGLGAHALDLLWDMPAAPIEEVLTALLNAMADLSDRLIVVLDNYHTITTPAIHQALTFLLDYLPSQLHIVLAGRTTPPLPIARLRARAELSELGAADLCVTQDEATVLLQQIMGLDLTARDIGAITARTEGWITGLHLAGLARQQELDRPAGSVTVRGSDRYLFDYLIEEVLKQQTEPVQTFLLQTALLDRLNGDLCDAVLGIENEKWKMEKGSHLQDHSQFSMFNSQLILEELERANLFIIPLDTERRWYRYHPLFGEALQTYLHHTNPGMAPDLQRRAAEWYEQQQGTPDAALPDRESTPMERASQPATETTSNPLIEPLSLRELEVLRLVTDGLPNQAVAKALVIGGGTVKTHLINIYAKLGVHSRTQAVARARTLGLV
jgi:LuxR family maltose regulon positive regulatory protein